MAQATTQPAAPEAQQGMTLNTSEAEKAYLETIATCDRIISAAESARAVALRRIQGLASEHFRRAAEIARAGRDETQSE